LQPHINEKVEENNQIHKHSQHLIGLV